jgi:hypothetical protein
MTTPSFAMVYASANFGAGANSAIQYNTIQTTSPYLSYFTNNGTWTALQSGYVFYKAYLTCTQTVTGNIYMQIVLNNNIITQESYHGRTTNTYYNGNTISLWAFGGALLNPGDNFSAQPGAAMSVLGGIGNSYATCVFIPQNTGGAYPSISGSFYSTALASPQTFTSNTLVNWAPVLPTFFLDVFGSSFQALVTGFYEIMGVITFTNYTSAAQTYVQVVVNGVSQLETGFLNYLCATPSGELTVPFTYKIRLTAGSTFYIQVNNSGTSLTMAAVNTYLHVLMTQQG